MKQPYRDILNLTDQEPLWYDEEGVPRFVEFSPDLTNNIYADKVALVELGCQSCKRTMKCAISSWNYGVFLDVFSDIEYKIKSGFTGYGDPPCWSKDEGQCAGSTMTPDEIRVLEFWKQNDKTFIWERVPELEVKLDCYNEYYGVK